MEQKYHCSSCKSVGGRDGKRYKCTKHKSLCTSCIEAKGFFTTKYFCKECGKEAIGYEWNGKKYAQV